MRNVSGSVHVEAPFFSFMSLWNFLYLVLLRFSIATFDHHVLQPKTLYNQYMAVASFPSAAMGVLVSSGLISSTTDWLMNSAYG